MEEQERKTTEPAEKEIIYGIKESDITKERLKEIMMIYVQTVGGAEWMLKDTDWLTDLQGQLRDAPPATIRLGSRLSDDSRFCAGYHYIADEQKIVAFSFAHQLKEITPTRKMLKKAEKLGRRFKNAVNIYLRDSGIGIPTLQQ